MRTTLCLALSYLSRRSALQNLFCCLVLVIRQPVEYMHDMIHAEDLYCRFGGVVKMYGCRREGPASAQLQLLTAPLLLHVPTSRSVHPFLIQYKHSLMFIIQGQLLVHACMHVCQHAVWLTRSALPRSSMLVTSHVVGLLPPSQPELCHSCCKTHLNVSVLNLKT